MCNLNVTALIMEEYPQYFGVDKLIAMVSGWIACCFCGNCTTICKGKSKRWTVLFVFPKIQGCVVMMLNMCNAC